MKAIMYKGRARLHIKQRNYSYYGAIEYKTERLDAVVKDDRVDRNVLRLKIHASLTPAPYIKANDTGKVSSEFAIDRF